MGRAAIAALMRSSVARVRPVTLPSFVLPEDRIGVGHAVRLTQSAARIVLALPARASAVALAFAEPTAARMVRRVAALRGRAVRMALAASITNASYAAGLVSRVVRSSVAAADSAAWAALAKHADFPAKHAALAASSMVARVPKTTVWRSDAKVRRAV
jgi:hypothetical protein